jgi:flagellar biosynthesis regulator FlbT
MRAVEEDRCYDALKLIRRIIRHEDAVMGLENQAFQKAVGL